MKIRQRLAAAAEGFELIERRISNLQKSCQTGINSPYLQYLYTHRRSPSLKQRLEYQFLRSDSDGYGSKLGTQKKIGWLMHVNTKNRLSMTKSSVVPTGSHFSPTQIHGLPPVVSPASSLWLYHP